MDHLTDQIRARLARVQEEIEDSARVSHRSVEDIHLVVVTKAQPVEKIQAVIGAGMHLLGENYPEETVAKMEAIGEVPGLEWHMIGHLQSRKAGIVAEKFTMLHSLDSLRLARLLERRLAEIDRTMPVLLELNVGEEASKGGWSVSQSTGIDPWLPEIEEILAMDHLEVRGLMAMPPLAELPEQSRPYFAMTRLLLEDLAKRYPHASKWDQLSMGTSSDYAVAIEEGSTYVRIGTAIVGPRPPRQ